MGYRTPYSTAYYNGTDDWFNHFDVSRTGYDFAGWYGTQDNAHAAGADSIRSDSLYSYLGPSTVYAGWKAKTYIVTYVANPGSVTGGDVVGDATKEVTYKKVVSRFKDNHE